MRAILIRHDVESGGMVFFAYEAPGEGLCNAILGEGGFNSMQTLSSYGCTRPCAYLYRGRVVMIGAPPTAPHGESSLGSWASDNPGAGERCVRARGNPRLLLMWDG